MRCFAFIFLLLSTVWLSSCQREIDEWLIHQDSTTSPDLWVIKRRSVQYFNNVTPSNFGEQTRKSGFYYDSAAKSIVVKDTILHSNEPGYYTTYTYRYDGQGHLTEYIDETDSLTISYNSDDVPDKITFYDGWMGTQSNQWNLNWNAVPGGYSGIMTDPMDISIPYSSGNRLFNITAEKKLISEISVPTNPAGDFQKVEAVRTANGDVSTMKISFGKGNNLIVTDSVVYQRDNGYPPRLYDFYHFWSGGLDWLPTSGPSLSVGFTLPPSMFNDLFHFEQNLINKFTYYRRDNASANYQVDYSYTFQTQYDTNKNPVKITMIENGVRMMEIGYEWRKIGW